jgi:hypothetical protein
MYIFLFLAFIKVSSHVMSSKAKSRETVPLTHVFFSCAGLVPVPRGAGGRASAAPPHGRPRTGRSSHSAVSGTGVIFSFLFSSKCKNLDIPALFALFVLFVRALQ